MRNIRATDVERPSNILGIGDQERISAKFFQFRADPFKLVGCGFAGKFELAQGNGARWRCWPTAPQCVDGIAVNRHQFGACRGASPFQLFCLFAGL